MLTAGEREKHANSVCVNILLRVSDVAGLMECQRLDVVVAVQHNCRAGDLCSAMFDLKTREH